MGFDVLDILDLALKNYISPQTSAKFMTKTDFHWSSYGAQISAKLLAKDIISVDNCLGLPKVDYKTTYTVRPRLGNLGTELLARCGITVPPDEQIQYSTKRISPTGDLLEEEAPSIALIGTSFSLFTDFNFLGFLEEFTRLDIVNYSTEGGGKFSAMEKFLKNKENITNPPPFVIWEFPNYSYLNNNQIENLTNLLIEDLKNN